MKSNPLCIYHGNCADGFGAAWVAHRFFGANNVDFHAGVYQTPPPDVTGRDVILVDFSYKRAVLIEMARKANSLIVIDHHKSAAEDLHEDKSTENGPPLLRLETWDGPMSWQRHMLNVEIAYSQGAPFAEVFVYMDMKHSGAMLAWHFFFGNDEPPMLLRHVEDRDLWRFKLEGTREIQASLFSYPYDFDVWDQLMSMPTETLRGAGNAIERKHFKDIDELLSVTRRTMNIGGHIVPVANLPYTMSSDAGHKMAIGRAFAACYYDTPAGRCFSLRSNEHGEDVSRIAMLYGGGGHREAAGFTVPWGHELTLPPSEK